MKKAIGVSGWVAMCGVAILLVGCGGMTEQEKQAAASATKLTGAEISVQLVGNTLSGATKKNEAWTEYYADASTIKGLWKEEYPYTATWRVEGDQACYDYEDDQYDGCVGVAVNGSQVFFLNEDGLPDGRPAKLESGNPRNL
jgi:hypothetical protein